MTSLIVLGVHLDECLARRELHSEVSRIDMLVLHKTLKTFGGTIQIQPSVKKEARLLCGCIIVLAAPPAATECRFIQTYSTISIA